MDESRMGKVWLVGAGPGDVGLLTVKGKKLLESADVVVYDQLASAGILTLMPERAEKIDAGKHARNHKMEQKEINRVLVEKAAEGKRVVRLKGGDPFLFGRGGEEMEALCKAGIPCEVVPGVTSAVAVPAYAGIPVTHRDYTPSLHIVTAHRKRGNQEGIDYKALAALGDVTLVFFMGIGSLPEIARGLIEAGVKADRPSAVIENGTRWNQRVLTAPLCELPERAKEKKIGTPGLILVGRVCELAEQFPWFSALPLSGKRIWVVRPREKESVLIPRLQELGAEVMELPATKICALEETPDTCAVIKNVLAGQYAWLLFTSEAGVTHFFKTFLSCGGDSRKLAGVKIGSVGPATSKALKTFGILPDLEPKSHYGKNLGEEVAKEIRKECRGKLAKEKTEFCKADKNGGKESTSEETARQNRVLLCLPEGVQSDCAQELEKAGCDVTLLPVYRLEYQKPEWAGKEGFLPEKTDIAMFASASAVQAFAQAMEGEQYLDMQAAVCIGKKTREAAETCGFAHVVQSEEVSIDSMIEAVLALAQKEKKAAALKY